jgi:hypothetical protein
LRRLFILLLLATPALGQEVFVHVIPPGCSSVTVPATPINGGSVTITCPPLAIITPVTLPQATQNAPYNVNLAALAKPTGGVAPYTYTLNKKGPVPPTWLKLSLKGVVSGTPTATGTVNFAFTVYDSSAKLTQGGQGSFNVNQAPIPAIVNFRALLPCTFSMQGACISTSLTFQDLPDWSYDAR